MAEEVRHEEFAARMVKAAEAVGGPLAHRGRNAEFARRMSKISQHHVSADTARRWFEGYALPRYNRYPEIAEALGVRLEWLESGKGEMFPTEEEVAGKEGLAVTEEAPPVTIDKIREGLERSAAAATLIASALTLRGVPASASGSVITARNGSTVLFGLVGVANAGEVISLPARDGMMRIVAVLGPKDDMPGFAVIPAGPTNAEGSFQASPAGDELAGPEGARYPVVRSLAAILAAA